MKAVVISGNPNTGQITFHTGFNADGTRMTAQDLQNAFEDIAPPVLRGEPPPKLIDQPDGCYVNGVV